jgi:hypothetical protein
MGRLPNDSDSGTMEFTPSIAVTSYDVGVKKVIHSVWVRERTDVFNPGTILGHRDLQQAGIPSEERLLKFQGPKITHPTSKFHEVVTYPIFIETSDGAFYKAESWQQPYGSDPISLSLQKCRTQNQTTAFQFEELHWATLLSHEGNNSSATSGEDQHSSATKRQCEPRLISPMPVLFSRYLCPRCENLVFTVNC